MGGRPPKQPLCLQAPPGDGPGTGIPSQPRTKCSSRIWSRRKREAQQSPRPRPRGPVPPSSGSQLPNPGSPEGLGWGWTRTEQNFGNCWGLRFLRVGERGTRRIREGEPPTGSTRKFLRVREGKPGSEWGSYSGSETRDVCGETLRVRRKMLFRSRKEAGRRALRVGSEVPSFFWRLGRPHQPGRWLSARHPQGPRGRLPKNSREVCRSLEGQTPQPGGRESPSPGGGAPS